VLSHRALTLPLLALIALLVAAGPASAKPKAGSWTYSVTVRAEMKEAWSYAYATASPSPDGTCTNDVKGSGTASVQVKTKRPQKVMVLRGFGGRPPMVGVGSEPFVVTTGPYLRQGSLVDEHGGYCASANPPVVQPTTGCGSRAIDIEFGFAWEARGVLRPSAYPDLFRDDCPSSGRRGVTWKDDASPSLADVATQVAPKKFLGTKQFTIRGTRKFQGSVDPVDKSDGTGWYYREHGQHEATWSWEATFRLDKPKKPRKRTRR
jgi:hypothetical protein